MEDTKRKGSSSMSGEREIGNLPTPIINVYTVQTETYNGPEFYRHYSRKHYAGKVYDRQVEKLQGEGRAGCVSLFLNHELVKEQVLEGIN